MVLNNKCGAIDFLKLLDQIKNSYMLNILILTIFNDRHTVLVNNNIINHANKDNYVVYINDNNYCNITNIIIQNDYKDKTYNDNLVVTLSKSLPNDYNFKYLILKDLELCEQVYNDLEMSEDEFNSIYLEMKEYNKDEVK